MYCDMRKYASLDLGVGNLSWAGNAREESMDCRRM